MGMRDMVFETCLDKARSFVPELGRWKTALGHELSCVLSGGDEQLGQHTLRLNVERWWMGDQQDHDCSPDYQYSLAMALEDFFEKMFLRKVPFTETAFSGPARAFEWAGCRYDSMDEDHLSWMLHDMQGAFGPSHSFQLMYRRKRSPDSLVTDWWYVRLSYMLFDKAPVDDWVVLDEKWMRNFWKRRRNRYAKN